MRIHLIAGACAVAAGILLDIKPWQWVAIIGCICLVLVCELLNTAFEKLCDVVTLRTDPAIGYIKDIAAAAVLLSCVFAVVTGLLIFGPEIISLSASVFY